MSNNGSVQHSDLSHSSLWRRCLRTFARAALAGGCLAHVALVLLALAGTAPVLVSPAAAQQTFCQPEGSANCGACNVNNGLVACNTIYPADGKQISTFTDLNSGAQSVIVTQKPDSTTHACATGFTVQADGSCSSLSQTQGQVLSGTPANLGTPNLGCTTGANGNTNCSGCSISNGNYTCQGTDPSTGAYVQSSTNLATGQTTTSRLLNAGRNACPSGFLTQEGGVCAAGNMSQPSPLLQSATAPKTSTPTTTTPPTTPVTTTPTTPPAPTPAPVKTTTPTPTPTKPVLTVKQTKERALIEQKKKQIETVPKAAAETLKRDQLIEKKAAATHDTKLEATAKARDKLAERTIAKANPKLQVQVKQQLQQQAKKVQVTTPVKTRTAPVIKPKCLGKKCPA